MSSRVNRRGFLTLVAGSAAGAVLASCGPTPTPVPPTATPVPPTPTKPPATAAPAAPTATPVPPTATKPPAPTPTKPAEAIAIRWWDQFLPLVPLHKKLWEAYSQKHPNVTVQYTQYTPEDLGKALQLAYPNKQAPDVHSLAGIGLPVSALIKENWFTPLESYVTAEWKKRLPAGTFVEGITMFGGKAYSFPLFSFRQHTTLNWFNKDLLTEAGYDPEKGITTWDEFRTAAQKITKKGEGKVFGWIQGIQFIERNAAHLSDLAQVAGAPGGINWETGEYTYHTDPYANAVEFLVSLARDGSLFPGSTSLNARTARARWVTGVAGMFFDGPWNIGVLKTDYAAFMDKTGVADVPVPNAGQAAYIHVSPAGGVFWISRQSKDPQVCAAILQLLTTEEYYIGLAERMDQPPLDLAAVEKANVHPTYKKAMIFYKNRVRLQPDPVVRNPAVAQVYAEMTPVRPNLGEIVQGAITGDLKDFKAALKDYSSKTSAERERALKIAQGKGAKVTLDDWVFANWEPDKDYTSDMYR